MAGMMHKIDDTLNIGGKKDERKGENNQQEHRGDAQGQRKEGFADQMKDKIPGVGGGVHKGETQGGYNQQGGCNQQDHRGGAPGERKEGFVGQMKDKLPGGGGGGGMTQGGYNQQEHRGGAQGEPKEGFVGQMKDKLPGGGGASGVRGEGGEK